MITLFRNPPPKWIEPFAFVFCLVLLIGALWYMATDPTMREFMRVMFDHSSCRPAVCL